MRYYIKRDGKLSSITISEELSQYLIIKLGGSTPDLGALIRRKKRNGKGEDIRIANGKSLAQHWINELIESATEVPEKNVSQWVQAQILHFIVDPQLRQKLDLVAAGVHPHSGNKIHPRSRPG